VRQAVDAVVAEAAPGGRHERTLVAVLGDHGQTAAGEHGGGTPAEAHTVLLALSAAALHRRRSGYAARPAQLSLAAAAAGHRPRIHPLRLTAGAGVSTGMVCVLRLLCGEKHGDARPPALCLVLGAACGARSTLLILCAGQQYLS